jgi:hypothetical protein
MVEITDRVFAAHVLERQEHLISAMHNMLDTQEIIRDTCFEIRDEMRQLAEWLREPPSNDLADAIRALAEVVSAHIVEDRDRHQELISGLRSLGAT